MADEKKNKYHEVIITEGTDTQLYQCFKDYFAKVNIENDFYIGAGYLGMRSQDTEFINTMEDIVIGEIGFRKYPKGILLRITASKYEDEITSEDEIKIKRIFKTLTKKFVQLGLVQKSSIDDSEEKNEKEPEPWLEIPDVRNNRMMIKMLYEGKPYKEIGRVLDRSEKTIRNRISDLRSDFGDEIVPRRR